MQTLVIGAIAAFGHNHFFKNNYLFKLWTDAHGILDYLNFAKGLTSRPARSVTDRAAVEPHAGRGPTPLMVARRSPLPPARRKLDLGQEERRERDRREHQERNLQRSLAHRAGRTLQEPRPS